MKARLVPVYFPGRDEDFDKQSDILKELLAEEAEILEPVALGSALPEADAVLFPQMLGDAYRMLDEIRAIDLPLLVITSEFGTVLMWDWEICRYLKSEGVDNIAPSSLEQTRVVCQGLAVKRDLKSAKFLVFQDDPGEGMQSEIFKRFYWWEPECLQRMQDKFGVTIEKRSFEKLAADAKAIPDSQAEALWQEWQFKLNIGDISKRALNSALKIYIVVAQQLDSDDNIKAVGINCLNESRYSDTTPCLAWNMLYEDREMVWGCEADVVSMLTKYVLHKSLGVPIMMTNLYPFMMGKAALAHERIPFFPETDEPEHHILAAHCGYFGVVPQSFSTEWALRKKVLAIVDDNATAIDARMPVGDMTLAKLHPTMETISVAEGEMESYVQYDDSDCLNGAVLKIADGHKLLETIASHHYLVMNGHNLVDIKNLAKIYDLELEVV
jgi:hypothetical protein